MSEEKKNPLTRFIEEKLIPLSTGFAQNPYIRMIGGGSQALMAIIMIGAIFGMLNSIAFDPYQNFLTATGIGDLLSAVNNGAMNFLGIFMAFSVAYVGAKTFGHEELALNNGFLCLLAYLIVIPYGTDANGSAMVLTDYLGSHGIFLSFVLGILVTKINILIVEKKITIRMPEGVPENVTQSFIALIPGAVICIVCGIIRALFMLTPYGNVLDAVYALLQTPLGNLTGSLPGFIILLLLAQILWFFGVHGSYTVLGILYPIWFTYIADNMAAAAAGETIPHLWNVSMYDFACNGGCGCTLGLVILMFFCSKSKRYKTFSKVVFPCGIFNINEPLVYGLPLMMNFEFIIPFIVTPIVSLLMAYGAIMLGLMPAPTGIIGLNSMPIFIYGVMQGSWKIGVYQIVATVVSALIWYPFFRAADSQALKEEQAAALAEENK